MQIKTVEFVQSYADQSRIARHNLPEIAIVGRSNVGKSSFINMITNHSKLARVSSTPGKTRLLNCFIINKSLFVVDLPGYGYAQVSKQERESWGNMVGQYLSESSSLTHVFFLVDIRHEPSAMDEQMVQWLRYYSVPFTVICTKADKVSKMKIPQHLSMIKRALVLDPSIEVIASSTITKQGRPAILVKMGLIASGELKRNK